MDAIGDQISPKFQAQRQVERLRQSGLEPARVVAVAAALMLGLLLIRRRRHAHREG